jgi:hypothetical protein
MSLTTVERLVLESLGQGPKDIPMLMSDTRLELRFLANILHALTLRNFIVSTPAGYAINSHLPESHHQEVNNPTARRSEAMELISGLIAPQESQLRIQKTWMTDKDRTILRAMLKSVEDFVKGLPSPPKDAPTHTWSVVVWGEDRYGSVVNRLLAGG